MGLKGATSYFQMLMTNLLGELVGEICEVYLDDIIVYAQSEAQLIERLEIILAKIRAAKLVLSPPKCKFGKTEIGFLGHTINADGISFTRDQKDGVLKLSRPKSASQLRSFLGLCNVFRQHVEGHAQIVKPLNKLVGHKSAKRLEWTEEANRAFEEIRMKIDKCPALFFIDEVSPAFPGAAYSTVALPPTLCTLSTGVKPAVTPFIWHDATGFPSLSADGKVLALHCWKVANGTAITDASSVVKSIAVVRADGSIDTTTTTTWPYGGTATYVISMHNVATATGSSFYTAMGGG